MLSQFRGVSLPPLSFQSFKEYLRAKVNRLFRLERPFVHGVSIRFKHSSPAELFP
jgi:hypothetical protein